MTLLIFCFQKVRRLFSGFTSADNPNSANRGGIQCEKNLTAIPIYHWRRGRSRLHGKSFVHIRDQNEAEPKESGNIFSLGDKLVCRFKKFGKLFSSLPLSKIYSLPKIFRMFSPSSRRKINLLFSRPKRKMRIVGTLLSSVDWKKYIAANIKSQWRDLPIIPETGGDFSSSDSPRHGTPAEKSRRIRPPILLPEEILLRKLIMISILVFHNFIRRLHKNCPQNGCKILRRIPAGKNKKSARQTVAKKRSRKE